MSESADLYYNSVYTKLTFSLLEDTQWYDVTYDGLDEFLWGREKGCDFVDTCTSADNLEFSDEATGCTWDHNSQGASSTEFDSCPYLAP